MSLGAQSPARLWRGPFALLLLVLGLTSPGHAQRAAEALDPAAQTREVVAGVQALRTAVSRDYKDAFRSRAAPGIEEKIQRLDRVAWGGINPQIGWSFLLGTSPAIVAGVTGSTPLTAFYHPWSDVVFLVAWGAADGKLAIQDIELLDATMFRSPELPTPSPDPAWAENEEPAPLSVARETARVIHAFEQIYPANFQGDWRRRLKWLSNDTFRGLNEAAVALRLSRVMAMFVALRLPREQQTPEIARLKRAAERLRTRDIEAVLTEARYTPPGTAAALRKASAQDLQALQEISALPASSGGVLFFSPVESPDFFLSLALSGEGSQARIERIDLIEFLGVSQRFQQEIVP